MASSADSLGLDLAGPSDVTPCTFKSRYRHVMFINKTPTPNRSLALAIDRDNGLQMLYKRFTAGPVWKKAKALPRILTAGVRPRPMPEATPAPVRPARPIAPLLEIMEEEGEEEEESGAEDSVSDVSFRSATTNSSHSSRSTSSTSSTSILAAAPPALPAPSVLGPGVGASMAMEPLQGVGVAGGGNGDDALALADPFFRVVCLTKDRYLVLQSKYEFSPGGIKDKDRSGGFGAVFLATRQGYPREMFALKFFHPEHQSAGFEEAMLTHQLWVKGVLEHRNIVPVVEVYTDETQLTPAVVVTEYALLDELQSYVVVGGGARSADDQHSVDINATRRYFEPSIARYIFRQTMSAIVFLHEHSVVHRDTKAENFLLTLEPDVVSEASDGVPVAGTRSPSRAWPPSEGVWVGVPPPKVVVKLCDFGLAKDMGKDGGASRTSSIVVAKSILRDPSMGEFGDYDPVKSDVWLLGNLLFLLLTGHYPLESPFLIEQIDDGSNTFVRLWDYWEKERGIPVSKSAKQLLNRMLCLRAEDRFTLDEVLQSDWMREPVASSTDVLNEFLDRDPMLVSLACQRYGEKYRARVAKGRKFGDVTPPEVVDETDDVVPEEPFPTQPVFKWPEELASTSTAAVPDPKPRQAMMPMLSRLVSKSSKSDVSSSSKYALAKVDVPSRVAPPPVPRRSFSTRDKVSSRSIKVDITNKDHGVSYTPPSSLGGSLLATPPIGMPVAGSNVSMRSYARDYDDDVDAADTVDAVDAIDAADAADAVDAAGVADAADTVDAVDAPGTPDSAGATTYSRNTAVTPPLGKQVTTSIGDVGVAHVTDSSTVSMVSATTDIEMGGYVAVSTSTEVTSSMKLTPLPRGDSALGETKSEKTEAPGTFFGDAPGTPESFWGHNVVLVSEVECASDDDESSVCARAEELASVPRPAVIVEGLTGDPKIGSATSAASSRSWAERKPSHLTINADDIDDGDDTVPCPPAPREFQGEGMCNWQGALFRCAHFGVFGEAVVEMAPARPRRGFFAV